VPNMVKLSLYIIRFRLRSQASFLLYNALNSVIALIVSISLLQ